MLLEATNSANSKLPLSSSSSSTLIAFKPRQVLLAQKKSEKIMKKSLTPNQKILLLHSVIRYVEKSGFSKTLKRFLSEAQIENDNWKASSLDLEDLFCEFSDKCGADQNPNNHKNEESQNDEGNKIDGISKAVASEETLKKKKKKKTNVEDVEEKENVEVEVEHKEEKKKKKKNKPSTNDSSALEDNHLDEKKSKSKDKGTKVVDQEIPIKLDSVEESLNESVKKEKKSSKRKRLLGDENKNEPLKEEAIEEEPKRRKTEAMGEEKSAKVEYQLMKDQLNKHENGKLDNNGGGKSAWKKSATKQNNNGSAEPKTVNAFQRVKIDEVEFADERLQDNSYWAKDGAEVGYGAKAQEILGQVRGRDFRHEKTKKKRGSYRGGQIDLDSHSIKFNYSDED